MSAHPETIRAMAMVKTVLVLLKRPDVIENLTVASAISA